MFFRSVAILTTLACVITSFAIPLVDPVGDLANGLSLGNTAGGHQLDAVVPAALVGTATGATGVTQVRRQDEEDAGAERRQDDEDIDRRAPEHLTLPDVFHGACAQLIPIADQLRACVSVAAGADIDVKLVVSLLAQVVVILKAVLVDVTFILNNPAGFVLSLKGTVLSIEQVGLVVGTLVSIVVPVVAVVLRSLNVAVHGAVASVVAEIGTLLAQILVIVVRIVPGILAHINVVIAPIVADILFLHYADLIVCLHLFALAH